MASEMNAHDHAAQDMRNAARHMRATHSPAHLRHAFWSALAGWLDSVAWRDFDDDQDVEPADWNSAVDVSKSYLEVI